MFFLVSCLFVMSPRCIPTAHKRNLPNNRPLSGGKGYTLCLETRSAGFSCQSAFHYRPLTVALIDAHPVNLEADGEFCLLRIAAVRADGLVAPDQLAGINSAERSVTGPISPDSSSGEFFVQWCHVVKVSRPVGLGLPSRNHCGHALSCLPSDSQSGGNCSSPMSRFGHRFLTLTTSLFTPGFAAAVRFTRHGGFHSTPRF